MDVETAYLNAKMIDDKLVYMKIGPLINAIISQLDQIFEKYQDGNGAVIDKLDKALYGCVELAVLWYKDLKATLVTDEYRVNPYDLCVFNKVYEGEQVTVIFHVDELLGACILSEASEDLNEVLIKKYKKVKVTRGKIHPYLGMIMNFQRPGVVTVANPGYMSDLVKEYGESTPMSTPADENLFNVKELPLL